MPETPMRTTGANIAWLRSFTAERARSMCDPLPTRKYPLTRMKMALPIFPHEAAAEKMKRRSYWIGWQKSPLPILAIESALVSCAVAQCTNM